MDIKKLLAKYKKKKRELKKDLIFLKKALADSREHSRDSWIEYISINEIEQKYVNEFLKDINLLKQLETKKSNED